MDDDYEAAVLPLSRTMSERGARGFRRVATIAAVLIALGSVFLWRALAPIHAVGDASECEQAYAKARTRTDSLAVDLMSYPDPLRRGVTQRCGWRHPTPMQLIQR